MKSILLFVILFILWFLMSGHYSILLISLGITSCAFCVYVAKRANIIDNEGLPLFFFPRIFNYLLWLFKEIFNSNIATAKVIITDKIDPEIFTIKVSQNSDVGKATFYDSLGYLLMLMIFIKTRLVDGELKRYIWVAKGCDIKNDTLHENADGTLGPSRIPSSNEQGMIDAIRSMIENDAYNAHRA